MPVALTGILLVGQPAPSFAAGGGAEFGADSSAPMANGVAGDYTMPYCSPTQRYDQYTGEVGYSGDGLTAYEQPATSGVDRQLGINQAHDSWQNGHGAGAASYYFLAGPNWAIGGPALTQADANAWGALQASRYTSYYNRAFQYMSGRFSWEFLIADVEWDTANQLYYGWSTNNTALNWYVWQGFVNALQGAGTNVEVYSTPAYWNQIMANRSIGQAEWTAENDYGPQTPCPTGMFTGGPGGYSAAFFANMSSSSNNALSWQWAIGGSDGGAGDFDQTDLTHYNNLLGTSYVP